MNVVAIEGEKEAVDKVYNDLKSVIDSNIMSDQGSNIAFKVLSNYLFRNFNKLVDKNKNQSDFRSLIPKLLFLCYQRI